MRQTEPISPAADVAIAPATRVRVSIFKSVTDHSGQVEDLMSEDLYRKLTHPAQFQRKVDLPLFSLAAFSRGRKDEQITELYGIVAEHDAGEVALEEAIARAKSHGIALIGYTTPSHKPEHPRWRVTALFSRPRQPGEFRRCMDRLNGALGGILAPESWTRARIWYFGSVLGVVYNCLRTDGYPIDFESLDLDIESIPQPAAAARAQAEAHDVIARASEPEDLGKVTALARVDEKTLADLRSALQFLDPDSRKLWTDVGQHLRSLGEQGKTIWLEWSARSPKFKGREDPHAVWDTFAGDRSDYRAVFSKAQAAGWVNPGSGGAAVEADSIGVIAALGKLTRDEVSAQWVAMAAPLDKAGAAPVVAEVHRVTGEPVRLLQAKWTEANTILRRERHAAAHARNVDGRVEIEYRPGSQTEMAEEATGEMVRRSKEGELVVFGNVAASVEEDRLPFTHLMDDADSDAPPVLQLVPLSVPGVRALIEKSVVFTTESIGGAATIDVPDKVIASILEEPSSSIPIVSGLLAHPIVLLSGEIISDQGLHRKTGLYLSGKTFDGIRPYDKAEAATALTRLRDVFSEFDFASELDTEIAVAGLITTIQRRVLDTAPGLAALACNQSSGKTTLIRMLHVLATGQDMPVMSLPGNEEEVKKMALAILQRSPELICFDNIPDGHTFRSAVLSAACTSASFTGRILGVTKDVTVPTNVMLALTGNNINLGSDEATRFLVCRLEPKVARPEGRTFKHADVLARMLQLREQVLRDVIGLVAGYLHSGATATGVKTRFSRWEQMVQRPIMWAGGVDVGQVFSLNREASESEQAHLGLLLALRNRFGYTEFHGEDVASVIRRRDGPFEPLDNTPAAMLLASQLRMALEALHAKNAESSRSIIPILKAFKGKRVEADGMTLWLNQRTKDGYLLFKVMAEGPSGESGLETTSLPLAGRI